MKTTSTRSKGNGDKSSATKPDASKAGTALFIGIASLAGAVFVFYILVMSFISFNVADIWPYVYYSLAFAGLMFAAYVSFHFYNKYRART